jgi:hypothetical protein
MQSSKLLSNQRIGKKIILDQFRKTLARWLSSFCCIAEPVWNKPFAFSFVDGLSLQVGDGEHSTVWQIDVLDGD